MTTRLLAGATAALLLAAAATAPAAELPASVWAADPAAARLPALPRTPFAEDPADAVQDLVYLAESHPVAVRFRIRLGEKPFRAAWRDFVGRLHRYLDADGDGVVTLKEAQQGSWQQMLQQNSNGPIAFGGMRGTGSVPASLDSSPKDGKVSFEELASYLRLQLSFGEFGLQAGPPADARTQAAFAHLDLDRDGKIAAEELAATDRCVSRLDTDEDEIVSLAELKPDQSPYSGFFGGGNQGGGRLSAEAALFVPVPDGVPRERLSRRIVGRYDKIPQDGTPADKKLTPGESGLPDAVYAKFDANRDGKLDAREIERWLGDPTPELEMAIVVQATRIQGPPKLEFAPARGGVQPLAARARTTREGGQAVGIEGIEVEFRTNDNGGDNTEFYKTQFKAADGDNNGYLDEKEANGNGIFNQVFAGADRDGDKKLFEPEFLAYLVQQADATSSRMTLSITDQGRSLYHLLDADSDQRLGVRELRQARARLAGLDKDGDGGIAQSEVPPRYILTIGRGQVFTPGFVIQSYDSTTYSPNPARGPAWFRKMDRNRDGDVSPREFLGPLDDFQRLDRDHDGLIDPDEAAKGP